MIRFFKLNDPYRLLVILTFLLLVRVAVLILGTPYLRLHIESESLGHFINEGGMLLSDIERGNAGPLYAYFYGLLTFLTANTLTVSVLLSAVFVFLQAFLLNTVLIRMAAFEENSYIPAFVYAVLMSASPDFMLLSPELVSVTFVLLAIHYLLTHLKYRGTEENIISTGFTLGLAALFARPAFFLLAFLLIVYLLYSNTLNRRYLLATFGFFLPFIFMWLFYFWNDQGSGFWASYFQEFVQFYGRGLLGPDQLLAWAGIPLFLTLVSAAQNFTGIGMTNNQIQIQRTMIWLLFFGFFFYLISANGSFNDFIWIMPAMAYFISMLFRSVQKSWMAELAMQLLFWGGLYVTLAPLVDEYWSLLDLSGLK